MVLDFFQMLLFGIYLDNHGFLSFIQFNNVYDFNWFSIFKLTLNSWNKSDLIMAYNSSILVCWIWFASILLKILSYFHKEYWSVVFFSCTVGHWLVSVSGYGLPDKMSCKVVHLLFSGRHCIELVLFIFHKFGRICH